MHCITQESSTDLPPLSFSIVILEQALIKGHSVFAVDESLRDTNVSISPALDTPEQSTRLSFKVVVPAGDAGCSNLPFGLSCRGSEHASSRHLHHAGSCRGDHLVDLAGFQSIGQQW